VEPFEEPESQAPISIARWRSSTTSPAPRVERDLALEHGERHRHRDKEGEPALANPAQLDARADVAPDRFGQARAEDAASVRFHRELDLPGGSFDEHARRFDPPAARRFPREDLEIVPRDRFERREPRFPAMPDAVRAKSQPSEGGRVPRGSSASTRTLSVPATPMSASYCRRSTPALRPDGSKGPVERERRARRELPAPASGERSASESGPLRSTGTSRSADQPTPATRRKRSGRIAARDVEGALAGSGSRTTPDRMSLGGAATWWDPTEATRAKANSSMGRLPARHPTHYNGRLGRWETHDSEVGLALAVLASCGNDSLSPAQRQEVRALIAEDRAEQARQVAEARQRVLEKHLSASVDRATEQYRLSTEQKALLLEVVRLDGEKVREVGPKLTEASQNADFDAYQVLYRDMDRWRRAELTTRFGENVGNRLSDDPIWLTVLETSLPTDPRR
jgi:hypothetical protein